MSDEPPHDKLGVIMILHTLSCTWSILIYIDLHNSDIVTSPFLHVSEKTLLRINLPIYDHKHTQKHNLGTSICSQHTHP